MLFLSEAKANVIEISSVADPMRPGGGGAEKHEIYESAFSGHLLYDLFLRLGHHDPLAHHGTTTDPFIKQAGRALSTKIAFDFNESGKKNVRFL